MHHSAAVRYLDLPAASGMDLSASSSSNSSSGSSAGLTSHGLRSDRSSISSLSSFSSPCSPQQPQQKPQQQDLLLQQQTRCSPPTHVQFNMSMPLWPPQQQAQHTLMSRPPPRSQSPVVSELAQSTANLIMHFWRGPNTPIHVRLQPNTTTTTLRQTYELALFLHRTLGTMQLCQSVVVLALLFIKKIPQGPRCPHLPSHTSEWFLSVAALMLGNKMLDDSTYTTKTWADVTGLPHPQLLAVEQGLLKALNWSLFVSVDEFRGAERLLTGLGLAVQRQRRSQAPLTPDTLPSPRRIAPLPIRTAAAAGSHALPTSSSPHRHHHPYHYLSQSTQSSPVAAVAAAAAAARHPAFAHWQTTDPFLLSRKRSTPDVAAALAYFDAAEPDRSRPQAAQRRRLNSLSPCWPDPQTRLFQQHRPAQTVYYSPSPQPPHDRGCQPHSQHQPHQQQQLIYYQSLAAGQRYGLEHAMYPQYYQPTVAPQPSYGHPQPAYQPAPGPSSFANAGLPAIQGPTLPPISRLQPPPWPHSTFSSPVYAYR